jgi:hypothetical protein
MQARFNIIFLSSSMSEPWQDLHQTPQYYFAPIQEQEADHASLG